MQDEVEATLAPMSSREVVSRQVRGEALCARIAEVIRDLAADAAARRVAYVYNASQVARLVPTTRRTLAKHDATISALLVDLSSRRRQLSGDATVAQLRAQIERLQETVADQGRLIDGLRRHHLEIYSRLRANSIEGELLIRPIVAAEVSVMDACPLCRLNFNHDSDWAIVTRIAE